VSASPTDRFRRVDTIFDAAVDIPAGEVTAYIDRECGDDAELRAEVLELVRAYHRSDSVLEAPAARLAAPLLEATAAVGGPVPDQIGPFRVVREIGRGGMGVVLLARDESLERDIAIKLLRVDGGATGAVSEQVLREARTLATMNHPNVATIHSLEVDAGRPFITMELVEGRSLRELLAAGPLPLQETLSIMRQVVRGLEAAHAKDVIHRDLKPANVMLRRDGDGEGKLGEEAYRSAAGVGRTLSIDEGLGEAVRILGPAA